MAGPEQSQEHPRDGAGPCGAERKKPRAAPAYKSLFVAVVTTSLIMDPWQYNDNNHIMHVCAEPVIPSAAPSALLGIVVCRRRRCCIAPGGLSWVQGAQSRVEEEDGSVVRDEGRELEVLGYLVLSRFPPDPKMSCSKKKRARSP